MDKNKLIEIKKRLLALGLAGVMLGTAGCTSNKDENGVPKRNDIPSTYSNIEDYYKYVMQNGEAVKLYKAENVYLLFDKETYDAEEYIFDNVLWRYGGQLYDLESEELLVYSSGISYTYNEKYNNYLKENNYQVCLKDVGDYVEGHVGKEYYSLDEIRELEPRIAESLKIINSAKVKTK